MSGPETAVQNLLRKTIANEIRLYGEHGNFIAKNDPKHTATVKTAYARMHRLLDECLSNLSPEQFADAEALNKAMRNSFQGLSVESGGKPGLDWSFDLGKGELAINEIVPGKALATLPIYKIAIALAGSRVVPKLVR